MTLMIRWLLIGALFCSPVAIAQHQLDHLNHAQTIEHCDLCSHAPSIDPDLLLSAQELALYSKQTHSVTLVSIVTTLEVNLVAFQQRAPPFHNNVF